MIVTLLGHRTSRLLIGALSASQEAKTLSEGRAVELARSNAFLTSLSRVATRIGEAQGPDQLLETLGVEFKALGIECVVAEFEGDILVVRYVSLESTALAMVEKLTGLSLLGNRIPRRLIPKETLQKGSPVFVSDPVTMTAQILPQLPRALVANVVRLMGISLTAPVLYLPLIVRDRSVGLMGVWGEGLDETDVPAFSVFAGQAATALENARLYEAEHLRAQELEKIGKQFTVSLDLNSCRFQASGVEYGQASTKEKSHVHSRDRVTR